MKKVLAIALVLVLSLALGAIVSPAAAMAIGCILFSFISPLVAKAGDKKDAICAAIKAAEKQLIDERAAYIGNLFAERKTAPDKGGYNAAIGEAKRGERDHLLPAYAKIQELKQQLKDLETVVPDDGILGVTANGIKVYDGSTIGGHVHQDVKLTDLADAIANVTMVGGFHKETVELDHVVGKDHLVKTHGGNVIIEFRRGKRGGKSRMVLDREAEATKKITVILCICGEEDGAEFAGKAVVVTAFCGELAEKEPWDSSIRSDEERTRSEEFWTNHALVPTEEEWDAIKTLLSDQFMETATKFFTEEDAEKLLESAEYRWEVKQAIDLLTDGSCTVPSYAPMCMDIYDLCGKYGYKSYYDDEEDDWGDPYETNYSFVAPASEEVVAAAIASVRAARAAEAAAKQAAEEAKKAAEEAAAAEKQRIDKAFAPYTDAIWRAVYNASQGGRRGIHSPYFGKLIMPKGVEMRRDWDAFTFTIPTGESKKYDDILDVLKER